MKRTLACLAALGLVVFTPSAWAQPEDPIGDLIASSTTRTESQIPYARPTAFEVTQSIAEAAAKAPVKDGENPDWKLKVTLYHAGAYGVGARDSLGCQVVAMRTAAVDPSVTPKRTILFIPETVGMPMPDGSVHDGYWYASDVGGAIKGSRIDLYTGHGKVSMQPMMKLNHKTLATYDAGDFQGCPKAGPRIASR